MRDGNKKSLTIVAGTTNRLLDVLIAALFENGWQVIRIQQPASVRGGRLLMWASHLTGAVFELIKIFRLRSTTAFHFYGVRSFAASIILALIRWGYVIHFWGSDYFYWKNKNNFLLRYALRNAKCVTFANSEMLSDARKIFGEDIKFEILRFGLEALDFIDVREGEKCKRSGLIRVVVGTNSQVNQQHEKIIRALERVSHNILNECCFVFPLNYGDRANRVKVIERLSKSNFRYEILDEYIGGHRLADFRLDTDILIQVQKTDAMSGAMLESLYAGAKVITGAWLPYSELRALGVDWVEVFEIEEITDQLPIIIKKEINIQKNKRIVAGLARWSDVTSSWVKCYLK